jgi:dihydrofolate synthase / folylpolyglutamate synthase
MNYQQALNYINSYTDYEKTPVPHAAANYDLRRVVELMGYFDNPHLKTKAVHITGTKGKGSTAAMIASVLTAAGYKTGLYTSPHLLDLRERVRIGKTLIPKSALAEIMERLVPAIEDVNGRATFGKITTFEVLTAIAFMYFAERKTDYQVLEVGLGGTYDATNIIPAPQVCVITSISYDHTEILGNTLTEIAVEKCGIIKPGCPVVSAPQKAEAAAVIRRVCAERGCILFEVGRDITFREIDFDMGSQHLMVSGRLGSYEIVIPLLGEHQMLNAATAVGAFEVLMEKGVAIKTRDIASGMAAVSWPGRFQVIGRHPVIVLDGAHNPDSARRLRETVERYMQNQKAVFVFGASADKDIAGMAAELYPIAGRVIATRANHPRAAAPDRIAAEFASRGVATEVANNVDEALDRAVSCAGESGFVCITGSLFVVAEALRLADRFKTC